MKRLEKSVLAGWLLAFLASASGWCPTASAQVPFNRPTVNPFNPPVVSPFLNLNRGGNQAINYYGLVRPQLDTAAGLQQLQRQQQVLAQTPTPETVGGIPVTGHPAQFMSFSHYFNSRITNQATLRPANVAPATIPSATLPPAVGPVAGFGSFGR
jgi:hypothetical protein